MSAEIKKVQRQRRAARAAATGEHPATNAAVRSVWPMTAGPMEANFGRLRAPFSLRCGALLLDYTIVVLILASATIFARMMNGGARWAGVTVLTIGYLIAAAVAIINFVVLAALGGRTLGKWVTGLHIERRDGLPLSFGRACLRHLVGYSITLLTLGIGFLLAVFSVEGRALHDIIAGTVVVRGRAGKQLGHR